MTAVFVSTISLQLTVLLNLATLS